MLGEGRLKTNKGRLRGADVALLRCTVFKGFCHFCLHLICANFAKSPLIIPIYKILSFSADPTLAPKTWKYAWPNGIHPFLNKAYKKPEERFPGNVREYGVTASYTRFLWKGLYAQLDVMPTWQIFVNDNGKKIDDGFQIFNSYRVGYHIKLFKDKFFFQPSICMTHRAYHTKLPNGFKQLDDKWSKFIFPEPGLNFGFNF